MKKIKNVLLVALFFVAATVLGQIQLIGKVVDEMGEPLPGAGVIVKGTANGTATDFDGNFKLSAKSKSGVVVVSFIGYVNQKIAYTASKGNLGTIKLAPSNVLDEIIISGKGILDIAKERETPVAVSTIRASEIQEKMGNQEFPEILKATPSVYATKSSGGFGDSRINVRGFDQTNTAIIINGQPVNDMENGKVYWSNYSGLQDVASGIQIQRGLGASKLAVPSVGGTINVITKAADKKEGGFAKFSSANDNYFKSVVGYNTGLSEKGWAFSALFGSWQGDGYVDGTKGEGNTYFLALGYKPSDEHSFNFSITGSSQWHNQRSTSLTLEDQLNFGTKYNADWGYLNGKEYSFRRNFYNKPIASLNWDWDINENLALSTVAYGSWGRGGGTNSRGRNYEIYPYKKSISDDVLNPKGNQLDFRNPTTGLINFDGIVAHNQGITPYTGDNKLYKGLRIGTNNKYSKVDGIRDNISIRRAGINSHDWYGVISNLKYDITEELSLGFGVDYRSYIGYHYNVVNDLLGLDGYLSVGNKNKNTTFNDKDKPVYGVFVSGGSEASPFSNIVDSPKIRFYNIGKVGWLGANGILEYKNDEVSAVLQGGLSNQKYQRIDYFAYTEADSESEKENILGGYVKGGLNYNINEEHNVFANAGLIKRQPKFAAVFPNYSNNVTEDLKNETISSYELGYGFKSELVTASVNLYRTSWKDRWLSKGVDLEAGLKGTANFEGIEQLHSGAELELTVRPMDKLKVKGSFSYGDWIYKDNVRAKVFDDNQQLIGESTLYLKDVKVGDAAQMTASLGFSYKIVENFKVDADWNYAGNLYGDFSPIDDTFEIPENEGALKLPSYNLFDAGVSYKVNFDDKYSLSFRVNMNNVFDTKYISESKTNIHAKDDSELYDGIDTRNQVWFGFGRTWNASVRFNF
ncbi:TonB-dependent receptor domain-containing protein [Tenacibaculum finnmarkense]|uniref:TonB-dependent receptor n=1 Tax=Tenacibaculum finnmarkense TaxID=2781243 RepID=UPI00187B3B24|nr:TonB-dependent receptor [Tenacibaculum finnmarkense]MBE7645296.1 TonB-dependent receptor [Tenacibaculum finnmarkense genomovar ulcerans]MBE7647441.1 TonB-dependent receptor [Tenacibaculum finnmarkense genomovar ulcerans]MCD8399566.1 TonB-dependent receptor [Tenacibaculum finnmarkense genomovar ulcerans]MCD8408734.1 TonB-dependent receptor [Tenacibaculum finnmarkense genomovar ulcerans]MCD8421354.1 TonB-dependent receptor [Tenacibaculum finnmarkense genomovar ulcerans]